MSSTMEPAPPSKALYWTGWVLSILPSLMLVMSGVMKLVQPPMVLEGMQQMGIPPNVVLILGIVELTSTLLYLIPRTSVLGAILLTGYLGGAIEVHVQKGEVSLIFPAIFGILVWLGIYLRDARIRALIPLKN